MCQALAAADLAPQNLRGKATDMALVVMTGAEVGLPPMASLRLYTTWDGVPRLMAEGVRSIILSHPDCEYFEFKTCSDVEATWITKRRGRPEKSVTWTIERAKKAGLTEKDTWRKYPQDLLNARASMQLGRLEWPHIIAGMRSLEEARDGDFIEAEFTESKPAFVAPAAGNAYTRDPATGILYSGPVKPPAPPAGETKAEYDARTGTVRNTITEPPTAEAPKRGPGRPPKNEAAKPPTGEAPRPTSSSTAPSPAAMQPPQSASNANSAQTAGMSSGVEPRPTTTPPAASGSGASSPASGSPTIASSSTASSGPTESAETSSAANGAASGETEDGFGADDPVDTVLPDDVEAKMAQFRAWVAGCKNQGALRADLGQWQAWTKQRAEPPISDERFFKKGELTLVMQDLYGKRKGEVPA